MTWTEAESRFAENFDRYEPRIPQRNLALAIEDALAAGRHITAQAGCGVGKSYGAMVPAIDYAKTTAMPVVAATATKALQDQYIRDMETLQKVYREDFTFTILKGRGNYLCQAKLAEADEGAFEVDLDLVREAAMADDVGGDIDRLPMTLTPFERARLTTGADECPGKNDCKFGERCFAELAKTKAAQSDVIITNHSLLAIDAQLKHEGVALLPMYSALIIDEGHEFENYVTNSLGSNVSERSFTNLGAEITNFVGDSAYVNDITYAAKALMARLDNAFPNRKATSVALTPAMILNLEAEITALIDAIDAGDAEVRLTRPQNEQAQLRRKRILKRTGNMLRKIRNVVMADFAESVRWIERDPKRGILLCQAPLDVGPFLRESVWPYAPAVIMSATLAVGDDFSYLIDKLALPNPVTFDAGSPFDFTQQALTYVPKDIPDPTREPASHLVAVNNELTRLVKASNGRALFLFTSWTSLGEAYNALAPIIEGLGHRVLKQGEMSNRRLAEEFKNDEHSVLFAVKSFFTGIDIQGDALRLVVINKMPFPNPSDILFAARCEAVDSKLSDRERWTKGSFVTMSVPEAILTLSQAYGRLIRSATDEGVVAILDPRLHTKRYGKTVLAALPNARITTSLAEAEERLRALDV